MNSSSQTSHNLPQNIVRKNDFQGFIVRLVLEGVDMKFEPSRSDFETVLLNVFDVFIKAVSMVPRVETKLYPVEVSYRTFFFMK